MGQEDSDTRELGSYNFNLDVNSKDFISKKLRSFSLAIRWHDDYYSMDDMGMRDYSSILKFDINEEAYCKNFGINAEKCRMDISGYQVYQNPEPNIPLELIDSDDYYEALN